MFSDSEVDAATRKFEAFLADADRSWIERHVSPIMVLLALAATSTVAVVSIAVKIWFY